MNSLQDVIYRLEKVIQTGATDKDGMHPISAERVLEELKSISIDAKAEEILNHLYDAVNGINALVDRPSGEWIYGTDEDGNEDAYPWTCSICGEKYPWHPNYCPHCGARMKDVTEGLESRTDLIWYGDKTDLIGDETGRHTGWFGKGADDDM